MVNGFKEYLFNVKNYNKNYFNLINLIVEISLFSKLIESIQTLNFDLRNLVLKQSIPIFYQSNKRNYTILLLKHFEELNKSTHYEFSLIKYNFSVEGEKRNFAIDEKTEFINRDLKQMIKEPTSKKIKFYSYNFNFFDYYSNLYEKYFTVSRNEKEEKFHKEAEYNYLNSFYEYYFNSYVNDLVVTLKKAEDVVSIVKHWKSFNDN